MAMPSLIGPSAAFAQSGQITQLPVPVAIAADVKTKLPRKRRRPSLLLNNGLDPSSRNETLRPELDENDSQYEDQDVGDHRRHHPGQRRAQRADHAGAGDGPRKRPHPADHDRDETLD